MRTTTHTDTCTHARAQTNYLVPSWNQHIPTYCGSCYAHGTLASVQDRIKVAKGAAPPDIMLARQSFLNCAPAHGFGSGCHGERSSHK
jgi:Papain family cysteine protease